MSKKKFYAVKKGKCVGIYNTWDECKSQVNGFSGAEYKSFLTMDEAKEYVYGKKEIVIRDESNLVEAYVDGSYEHCIREYGSGVVILKNGEVQVLYFDYEGIEKWCTGVWKTNKTGTIDYKKYYDSIKDKLNVKFVKVKAHSGDKYNEEADKLAKKAIGL